MEKREQIDLIRNALMLHQKIKISNLAHDSLHCEMNQHISDLSQLLEFMENETGKSPIKLFDSFWANMIKESLQDIEKDITADRHKEALDKLNIIMHALSSRNDKFYSLNVEVDQHNFAFQQLLYNYVQKLLADSASDKNTFNKQDLVALLASKFREANGSHKSRIGLPYNIDFSLKNRVLVVHVNNPVANMQTNEAAFEAWIIILKAWLKEIDWVLLDYSVPANLSSNYLSGSKRGHYNRFLYRIGGFLELYRSWFVLPPDKAAEIEAFRNWFYTGSNLLNHPLATANSVIESEKLERQIESWLVFEEGKPLLCQRLPLHKNQIFNQLPVGVFRGEIASKNTIFTRGASAIDIWAIGKDQETVHLIELKCGKNKNVGIISETLFYTQILYQVCVDQKDVILFGSWGKGGDQRGIEHLKKKKYKQIALHYLAEQFHPLFDKRVLSLINEGLTKWSAVSDKVTYDYHTKRIF